jgi:hypothetical protein
MWALIQRKIHLPSWRNVGGGVCRSARHAMQLLEPLGLGGAMHGCICAASDVLEFFRLQLMRATRGGGREAHNTGWVCRQGARRRRCTACMGDMRAVRKCERPTLRRVDKHWRFFLLGERADKELVSHVLTSRTSVTQHYRMF